MHPLLGDGMINVSLAAGKHATMEELLDAVFSMQSMPVLHIEDTSRVDRVVSHSPTSKDVTMEAGEYPLLGAIT
jgi:hypothetical protein